MHATTGHARRSAVGDMFVGHDLLPTSATVNLVVTAGYLCAGRGETREGDRAAVAHHRGCCFHGRVRAASHGTDGKSSPVMDAKFTRIEYRAPVPSARTAEIRFRTRRLAYFSTSSGSRDNRARSGRESFYLPRDHTGLINVVVMELLSANVYLDNSNLTFSV